MIEYKVTYISTLKLGGENVEKSRFTKASSAEKAEETVKGFGDVKQVINVIPTITVGELWLQWVKSKEV